MSPRAWIAPWEPRFEDPPTLIIAAAMSAARLSPCQKSKRGVVIWHPKSDTQIAHAFNGPPGKIQCDGSADCRRDCPKRCVHAEVRAIRFAQLDANDAHAYELMHVKVDADGWLAAGDGPSCHECSREVLDSGIAGVWLFEAGPSKCLECKRFEDTSKVSERLKRCSECGAALTMTGNAWRFYNAQAFHDETLRHCKIYTVPR